MHNAARRSTPSVYMLLVASVIAICIVSLPGCSGCWRSAENKEDENKEKKKKEKPKPNFELARPRVLPRDEQSLQNFVKPRHWLTASQTLRANNFNFTGEILTAATNGTGTPLDLDRVPYRLTASRPVALAKGQPKRLEMIYYIPPRPAGSEAKPWLWRRLRTKGGGHEISTPTDTEPTTELKPWQYYLVVLARSPDAYSNLKSMHAVRPLWEGLDQSGRDVFYHVLLPRTDAQIPLPSNPMTWTAIANVLWDDVDPNLLSADQQQALLDWLHWGGQMIISGPNSLDALKSSFLSDHLPARAGRSVDLEQSAFAELNGAHWNVLEKGRLIVRKVNVLPAKPVAGIELELDKHAAHVPHTGKLVAERRVGRGRIVVTAFPLTHRQLHGWPGYDMFFNACLLRHPPREYSIDPEMHEGRINWSEHKNLRTDSRLVSGLRIYTRDASFHHGQDPLSAVASAAVQPDGGIAGNRLDANNETVIGGAVPRRVDDVDPEFYSNPDGGVGSWSDFSAPANLSRQALKDAAGIVIPEAEFVFQVLAAYLVVLVPINWCLFRFIGRVEWAWIAAPVIAVLCGVAVVRLAQLDIGFARSRTEVAILEVHRDYDRAHLTRYTALYSSLSSEYEISFDDESALVQPFSLDENFQLLAGQLRSTVRFDYGKDQALRGFRVASNSTSMVHSEQMHDLGGPLQLDDSGDIWKLTNQTDVDVQEVGVAHRVDAQTVRVAWVGQLDSGASTPLEFRDSAGRRMLFDERRQALEKTVDPLAGKLSLQRLMDLVEHADVLRPGDVRMVGWTPEQLPGVTIRPAASQTMFRTLVLAHLRFGAWPAPRPDKNTFQDVADAR